MNGLEGIVEGKLFTRRSDPGRRRGHKDKLFKPSLKKGLNCRKNFFSHRVINDWNNLPARVVNASSTNEFKMLYDDHVKKCGYGVKKVKT